MEHILIRKNVKQLILALGLIISILFFSQSLMPLATAQGMNPPPIPNIESSTGGESSFKTLAVTIINFFLYFLGFIATVMIIYGGAQYLTSAGSEEKIKTAKKIILYAVIGVIVILVSYAIVNTVLQSGSPGANPLV